MNLGQFRKMTEGLPDETPFILHMMSCPEDDLNVVVESIAPNAAKDRVDIHVSIVTDAELQEEGSLASGEDLIDVRRETEEKCKLLFYFVPDSVADEVHARAVDHTLIAGLSPRDAALAVNAADCMAISGASSDDSYDIEEFMDEDGVWALTYNDGTGHRYGIVLSPANPLAAHHVAQRLLRSWQSQLLADPADRPAPYSDHASGDNS